MIRIKSTKHTDDFIHQYLNENSEIFIPPLTDRINLVEYSKKIYLSAFQLWAVDSTTNKIIGFLACYLNDQHNHIGYITTFSVIKKFQRNNIGFNLLMKVIKRAHQKGFKKIRLEVNKSNLGALKFYQRNGFTITDDKMESFYLELNLT